MAIVPILIVEDETKVAQALKEGLERQGYEVAVARTGEEGYYLLDARSFDLVVLDLMLPGRSGLEILGTLRARDRGIPVLILTARDTVRDRVVGLELEYLLRNRGRVVSREMLARDVWRETDEAWSPDGALAYRSEGLRGEALGDPPAAGTLRRSLASVTLADRTALRVLSRPHRVGGRELLVRVALSEEPQRRESSRLLLVSLLALPVAIVIAAAGGHWLARRALGPLDRMARHAAKLTAETLGERLPVENPDDELGHLARVFNLSLARIEEPFAQLRRFTADASHELRTPLTAIRTVGEVALEDPPNPDRYREVIGSMRDEVDRLSRLVGSLLVLSRADAGAVLHRQEARLLDLAKESASLIEVLADEKGQRIEVRGDASLTAEVDGLILRQALLNLLDNAIKFSPRGAVVRIFVGSDGDDAAIELTDQGPGIPEEHRSRVFERFYRVDAARSREEGGAGLGLSIALWAVEAHGGRIKLVSEEGKGSTFRIALPRASAAHPPSPAREA